MGKFTLTCVSTTIVVGVDAMVGLVWLCDTLDTDVLNCTEFCLNSSCGENEKKMRANTFHIIILKWYRVRLVVLGL